MILTQMILVYANGDDGTGEAEETSSSFGQLRMMCPIQRLIGVANLSASLAADSVPLPSTGQAGERNKELLALQLSLG